MRRRGPVLAVVTVLTGITAGIGGMLLALLLHLVQRFTYGYTPRRELSRGRSSRSIPAPVSRAIDLWRRRGVRLVGYPSLRQSTGLDRRCR